MCIDDILGLYLIIQLAAVVVGLGVNAIEGAQVWELLWQDEDLNYFGKAIISFFILVIAPGIIISDIFSFLCRCIYKLFTWHPKKKPYELKKNDPSYIEHIVKEMDNETWWTDIDLNLQIKKQEAEIKLLKQEIAQLKADIYVSK